ncbi:MAG: hypothetical protein M3O94_10170, partial [Actinomycetota bacterium]|nr:hypothetical protein [Actinomycetota bacterium]
PTSVHIYTAGGTRHAGSLLHAKVNPHADCKSQLDNDNGNGISSQNFEASLDAYDSQGADDFKLTAACTVRTVVTAGTYSNSVGPADSFNVTFYKNASGTPGAVIKTQLNRPYTDVSGVGNVTVKLGRNGPSLGAHRYWVSVQANLDFSTGGYWFWNTNNTVRGAASVWQQPGNGNGTGCTTYTTTTVCIPGVGGDFAFAIKS